MKSQEKRQLCNICNGYHLVDDEYAFCTGKRLFSKSDALRTALEIVGTDISVDKDHTCRFNDGEQDCDCYIDGRNELRDELRTAFRKEYGGGE